MGSGLVSWLLVGVACERAERQKMNSVIINDFLKNDSEGMRTIYLSAAVSGFLLALLFWGAFWFYYRKSDEIDKENTRKEKENG